MTGGLKFMLSVKLSVDGCRCADHSCVIELFGAVVVGVCGGGVAQESLECSSLSAS